MSAKHTRGLWEVQRVADFDGGAIICEVGAGLIVVAPLSEIAADEAADAQLIAVAPELFAELEASINSEYNPFEPNNQSDRYKRLIALRIKAAGSAL